MTGTTPARPAWWTRPSRVLPLVATVLVLVTMLTPQQESTGRLGDPRLSSNLSGSMGAKVLANLAQRLGWRVQRDSVEDPTPGSGSMIHAVLAPPLKITPVQAHEYLQSVRAGDGLLLVLGERTPLSDSLGVAHNTFDATLPEKAESTRGCDKSVDLTQAMWADGEVHLSSIRWLKPRPALTTIFAHLAPGSPVPHPSGDLEAAAGFPYGAGRVAIVADPDLLRNDVIRRCAWGADIVAVQILEWLRAGGTVARATLVFDEYHQGFGRHEGLLDVVVPFLGNHPFGRFLLAIVLAGLVLLLALGPRPVVPVEAERVERRDPMEQVDALSHAYEQVHATRTVVARLVRGLRWRVERGGARAASRPDSEFLSMVATRRPALEPDVARIREALETAVTDRELTEVGAAIQRVEHTLTNTDS